MKANGHSNPGPGSYTATITATNAFGTDTCSVTVNVGDSYCADITELNSVYFGYGQSSLSADARERLDENIEILRRCPEICVMINAYSDGSEPGDAMRISQALVASRTASFLRASAISAISWALLRLLVKMSSNAL